MLKRIVRKLFGSPKAAKKQAYELSLCSESKAVIAPTAVIENCTIRLTNATLEVGENARLSNLNITIDSGTFRVGTRSMVESHAAGNARLSIWIETGTLSVGNCSQLRADVSVRWGGVCEIGAYTAINGGSEIRCDEKISIGSFNMVSYNCTINDTNTHNILPVEERRSQTMREYPTIGSEHTKPPTKPVIIGDDCWLGKGATILKGVTIGQGAIIATQSVVVKDVPAFAVAAGNPARIVKQNSNEHTQISN